MLINSIFISIILSNKSSNRRKWPLIFLNGKNVPFERSTAHYNSGISTEKKPFISEIGNNSLATIWRELITTDLLDRRCRRHRIMLRLSWIRGLQASKIPLQLPQLELPHCIPAQTSDSRLYIWAAQLGRMLVGILLNEEERKRDGRHCAASHPRDASTKISRKRS